MNDNPNQPIGIDDYVGKVGYERHAIHQTHFGGQSDAYRNNYDRIFRKKEADDNQQTQESK